MKLRGSVGLFLCCFIVVLQNIVNGAESAVNILTVWLNLFAIFIVPTILLNRIFILKYFTKLERLMVYIGGTLTLLMFVGLLANTLFPLLGQDKPLTLQNLSVIYDLIVLTLVLLCLRKRRDQEQTKVKFRNATLYDHILIILSTTLVILVVVGSKTLDTLNNNFLVLVAYFGVVFVSAATYILRGKIRPVTYPVILFLFSLVFTYSYSLRSNYLMGFDINQEFRVFRLTENFSLWDLGKLRDPYNACLSINILPTVLNRFTGIDGLILFKYFYPVVIGLLPVLIYLISRKFFSKQISFWAGFFFLSQAQFMFQLPALTRQGVALLFFGLQILVLFNKKVEQKNRNILFVIFGLGMIVSHYSTTYVALILFLGTYLINFLIKILEKKHREGNLISGWSISLLVVSAFLWNQVITDTSQHLGNVINNTLANLKNISNIELRSDFVRSIIPTADNSPELIKKFYKEEYDRFVPLPETGLYPRESYDDYKIKLVGSPTLQINSTQRFFLMLFHQILPWLIRGLIFLGSGLLILGKSVKMKREGKLMVLIANGMVIAIIVLPYISGAYNMERLFQQNLFVLAIPLLVSLRFLFNRFGNRTIILMSTLLFLANSIQTNGLLDYILIGKVSIPLSNNSYDYDRYYTHNTEVNSLEWLEKSIGDKERVFIDRYAMLKALSYTNIDNSLLLRKIVPPDIFMGVYVYSSFSNTTVNKSFVEYAGKVFDYNYPTDFLENNKNRIFSNGQTNIYK